MNIAIKYKAWDKKSKKMRRVDSIAFDEEGNIKVINLWGYDIIEQKEVIIGLRNEKDLKRVILLQSTGIKDKNDTEIYEGDIVESWHKRYPKSNEDHKGDLLVVQYCKYDGYLLHYLFDWCGISNNVQGMDDVSNYRVIGNIHENSELTD